MRRTIFRGALALIAAVVMAVLLMVTTSSPKVSQVLLVTQNVPAGAVVSSSDLGTVPVLQIPSGAVTSQSSVVGQIAQYPLFPGETLTSGAVGPTYGLGKGLVSITIPVGAAQSALAGVGSLVDVFGFVTVNGQGATTAQPLAIGVKVIGVYTTSAVPIVPQTNAPAGSSPGVPGLMQLAVTPAQAESILPMLGQQGATVWLVADPLHTLQAEGVVAPAVPTQTTTSPSTSTTTGSASSGSGSTSTP